MAEQVTLSRNYQVVIPKAVREQLKMKPGQKFSVMVKHGMVTLVPIITLDQLQGLLKGANPEGYREEEDEERCICT